MDELLKQLTGQLGIDESTASSATGSVMAMVKEHAGSDLFDKISSMIPGADESATSGAAGSEPESAGGGGMFGAIAGLASSAIGGTAGEGLELGAALSSAGLDANQMGGFISMVIEFIKDKVGDEVTEQLLEKVPMLKSLMGE